MEAIHRENAGHQKELVFNIRTIMNEFEQMRLKNKVLAWITKDSIDMDDEIEKWIVTEIGNIDCLKDKSLALLEILKHQQERRNKQ
jgi:hypothetical protein